MLLFIAMIINYLVITSGLNVEMKVFNHIPKSSQIEITNKRVDFLRKAAQTFSIFSTISLVSMKPPSAQAKTFFDTDVYGDKELKIATVNKLKQKLRNAILEDITIAPILLKISINDALGFNMEDLEGGPDGSIQYEIDRPENKGLERGLDVLRNIKKEMQRTNVISFADVASFAGSEALEAIGSGRIIVQVGRFDATKANTKTSIVNWNDPTDESVSEAFSKSGLGPKEITVLFGALGEIDRVVSETIEANKAKIVDDDDYEPLDEEPFVPVTFGKRDDIYGAKVGKGDISSKYFINLLKSNDLAADKLGKILIENSKTKEYVKKYSSNKEAFIKDLTETYLKMTLLGESYTTRNS